VGQVTWLPVGRENLRGCSIWGASGGLAMGQVAWLPVGHVDLRRGNDKKQTSGDKDDTTITTVNGVKIRKSK
jgi:hypothetical protein